jgi:hypothetical protein
MPHPMYPCVLALALVFTTLVACVDTGRNANKEAERGLLETVEKAKLIKDPWAAFKFIDTTAVDLVAAEGSCKRGVSCSLTPAQDDVIAYHYQLLAMSVVDVKEPQAFLHLYRMLPTKDSAYLVLQESASSLLFEYADSATDGPTTADILQVAGDYLVNGPEDIKNLPKAIEYYARAWRKGDARSASAAAAALLKAQDLPNAYLWALRCVKLCQLSSDRSVDAIKTAIPADRRKAVEALVGNASIAMMK